MQDITLGPIALHYKRKYERECEESLALAVALEEATEKNKQLVTISERLQAKLDAATSQIIPPAKKAGKAESKES